MNTMLLGTASWDLCVNAQGNIATATGGAALAQDAASAIRLFEGEAWYDTTQGVPYFMQVLGKYPPLSLCKALFVATAMTVPGVTSARCFIAGLVKRKLTGQVQITDATGAVLAVANF